LDELRNPLGTGKLGLRKMFESLSTSLQQNANRAGRDAQGTCSVYEDFPNCPDPPQVPLPRINDSWFLESVGVRDHPLTRVILASAFTLSGFRSFYRGLPRELDNVLRTGVLRQGFYPPVTSATLALKDDPRPAHPLLRAGALVKAVWDLHAEIRAGRLSSDSLNGQPLEMRQYLNLFATSFTYDGTEFRVSKSSDVSHMLVICRGKFYLLNTGQDIGKCSQEDIASSLGRIWDASKQERPEKDGAAIGILSNAKVSAQLRYFRRLLGNPTNASSFEALQHTFVTLCLDLESMPSCYSDALRLAHIGNPANRWFHSSLQIVIFGNSKACAICNFNAHLDGNIMMRGCAELQRLASGNAPGDYLAKPERKTLVFSELPWEIDRESLDEAYSDIETLTDHQQSTFELTAYGRKHWNSRGLNPIPAFIIALQLAVSHLSGRLSRIGQLVSIRHFRYMDLDIASVTTREMEELTSAWNTPFREPQRLQKLVLLAIQSQLEACRRVRSAISPSRLMELFFRQQKGHSRKFANSVMVTAMRTLNLFELKIAQKTPEILASHPAIYQEIPMVGRPGVRIPFPNCDFWLHYQIMEDRTTLTLTPSVRWRFSNIETISALNQALAQVLNLFPAPTGSPDGSA
jgi:hypothetical protein